MSETKCANRGSVWSNRAPELPWLGRAVLLVVLIGAVLLSGWMELGTWRQVRHLEATFSEELPDSFLLGVRTREGMERLTATLLLFELSSDPTARERFLAVAQDLRQRLEPSTHPLLTPAERALVPAVREEFERFLAVADPMLTRGMRGIRKDTAQRLHTEIQAAAAPVMAAADRLVAVQAAAARDFFANSRAALAALRGWLKLTLVLLVVLLGSVGLLVYRVLVTPLRARLSETESVIARQERLVSLGTLAAGMAHEIRNPLTAIKFRLFSLRQSLPGEASDQEDVAVIQHEIQRLERLVKEFLQFARPADPVLVRVGVTELLSGVANLLRPELERRGLRLELEVPDGLQVRADRQQFQQVLINLVLNAADASTPAGEVRLTARATKGADGRDVLEIGVADSGPGIPPDVAAQIFDPFFSTKEGGTGLGLPIAARIVEKHGGFLQFFPRNPRGTTFAVTLPAAAEDENQTAADRG